MRCPKCDGPMTLFGRLDNRPWYECLNGIDLRGLRMWTHRRIAVWP